MKRSALVALALLMSGSALAQVADPYGDVPPVVQPPPEPQTLDPYAVPPPTVPPPRTVPRDPYAGYPPPDEPRPAPESHERRNPYLTDPNACAECEPSPPPRYLATPPPVPQRRDRRGLGLLVGGLVLFGSSWVPTAMDAAFGTTPLVLIPVGGPIYVAVEYQRDDYHSPMVQLDTALLVLDAAAQTAGLVMAIVGGAIHGAHPHRATNVSWAGTGVRGTF